MPSFNDLANLSRRAKGAGKTFGLGYQGDPRPEPIPPVPEEQYRDDNNAYRGVDVHGVDGAKAEAEDYWGLEGRPVVVYADEPKEETVVPVRIVSGESSREFRRFRTDRRSVDGTPSEIVGRNDERRSLKITNMSADKTVYVASDRADLALTGYPLAAGKEFTTTSEDAVYMVSADGTSVLLAILSEYTVSEG